MRAGLAHRGDACSLAREVSVKVAGIREIHARSAALLGGDEPVLVTRHGRIAGVYVPLDVLDRLPMDLRRALVSVLGPQLSRLVDRRGVTEATITGHFRAHRKRRR